MFSLGRLLRLTGLLWVLALSSGASAESGLTGIPKPAAKDLCPVCGMIVSKYPNWTATVLYKDGHAHHFDGAKDMFKYLQDLPKYAPGHRKEDIKVIAVTDFYNLGKVDARQATSSSARMSSARWATNLSRWRTRWTPTTFSRITVESGRSLSTR